MFVSEGTIAAIPTCYNGYRFRSRLEARWAVFFDRIGLGYEYEPEGFQVGNVRYLPDFRVRDLMCYVEIKPKGSTPSEKQFAFVEAGLPLVVVCGDPWPWEYGILAPGHGHLAPFPTAQFATCCYCGIVSIVALCDWGDGDMSLVGQTHLTKCTQDSIGRAHIFTCYEGDGAL
jgi:hypothetical protein